MKFHLLGFDHIPQKYELSSCAFGQKILKMGKILKRLNYTSIFYGSEDSDCTCDKHVIVQTKSDRLKYYGEYDWKKTFFHTDNKNSVEQFNNNIINEMSKLIDDDDIILYPYGHFHSSVANAFPKHLHIESGVGYDGIFLQYKVFESYAWMHYLYSKINQDVGSWYDCVIPNYFDLDQHPFYEQSNGDYYLFIGRIIENKGIHIAIQVCQKLNKRLIVAGQGDLNSLGYSHRDLKNIEYVGVVDPLIRQSLYGNAIATFTPTYYIEPFGGVAVESQLAGTPVICTDWGAFTETVQHGKTGFRCRFFNEFLWAAEHAPLLSRFDCRKYAESNYSLERISMMYKHYFEQLYNKYYKTNDWYDNRILANLDWLNKTF